MKMQRMFLLIMSFIFLILCSCSHNNNNIVNNKQAPHVMTLWGGVPSDAGPQKVVDLWNHQNPDIQVEYVRYSNDDDGNLRLDTALLNDQGVDMFFNYFPSNYQQRVKMNLAANLSEMDLINLEKKMGAEVEGWKINGNYYAVPTKKNYYFVLLNKDELDKNNLPIPVNWTWAELKEYAKVLTSDNQWGFVQYDFVLPYPIDGTLDSIGYVKSNMTSNFDHVVVSNHLQLLYEMMYVDQSTPTLKDQVSKKMPVDTMFIKGEAAMLFGGEWVLRYINHMKSSEYPDFEIAFAPIPKISIDQKEFKDIGGLGDAISINVHSKYKQEALEFINWYIDEGMYAMGEGGRLPASKDADMERALSLLISDHDRFDKESLDRIIHGNITTHLSLEQEVIDLRKKEFEKYFFNITTIEETIENLVQGHNQILQSNYEE